MKRGCLTALVVLAAIIGGGVLWYRSAFPTYTYRYRMIVNVDTPEGVRSGASVIEVRATRQNQFIVPVPPYIHRVYGEAVFVDLGGGRQVVALLASGPNGSYVDYPQTIISSLTKLDGGDRDMPKYPHLEGRWQVPDEFLPTFVTFTDLNDPMSARVVYAIGRRVEYEYQSNGRQAHDRGHMIAVDDMAATFGQGIRLRDVIIEMTKDEVTRGIEKKITGLRDTKKWNGQLSALANQIDRLRVGSGNLIREGW